MLAPEVEAFLPTYQDKRIWSDRVKTLDVPLFSGYVFARFDWQASKIPVLRLGGVINVVSSGGQPAPLANSEVESIRTLVNSGFPLEHWPFLRAGQRVRIEHGPLRGAEGIVVEQKDTWRMVVSVDLLQRSVAVVLDRSVLNAVGPAPRAADATAGS